MGWGSWRRYVRFGILQRYVLGEVFRAFALSLLTITGVFVLLTVMTKATSMGLAPSDILRLVPYMIPGSLPYTVPVSLLFAATVVYGRLASDNEIIAVKTAGVSAMIVIWPAILLALVLSLALSVASATAIPTANAMAKKVVFQNIEDFFYKKLKMEREIDDKSWPFLISVRDVEGHDMIDATFKKRAKKPEQQALGMIREPESEEPANYDMIVQAKKAQIKFDLDHQLIRIYFFDANITQHGVDPSEGVIRDTFIDFQMTDQKRFGTGKTVEELTVAEMRDQIADYTDKIARERQRQAIKAAMWIGSGRINRVEWPELQGAFARYDYWKSECHKFETEIQMRAAMAWGSFFFVVLGAPVGILFARRDFLSAFISCFMPIIVVYYPLILFGVNLGKEGVVDPLFVWLGNAVLWAAAWFWALPPVRKH